MVLTWWHGWRRRHETPRDRGASAEWMLHRADDRLLADIGLTRNDLRALLDRWEA